MGLTLVSIGTSLPELLVTLSAADGHADMGMANVLGSNVANVLLIVGAAAAIRAIHVKTRALELSYMLVMTALACVPFFLGARLERWVSIVMLIVLGLFLFQLLARERLAQRLRERAHLVRAARRREDVHTLARACMQSPHACACVQSPPARGRAGCPSRVSA